MAQTIEPPQSDLQAQQTVPFWRDTRILGVFGQIGFIILVILLFRVLGNNFSQNVNRLGESQFICRDGLPFDWLLGRVCLAVRRLLHFRS